VQAGQHPFTQLPRIDVIKIDIEGWDGKHSGAAESIGPEQAPRYSFESIQDQHDDAPRMAWGGITDLPCRNQFSSPSTV